MKALSVAFHASEVIKAEDIEITINPIPNILSDITKPAYDILLIYKSNTPTKNSLIKNKYLKSSSLCI